MNYVVIYIVVKYPNDIWIEIYIKIYGLTTTC